MSNRIEGYIGCPQCKTALFRLEAEPADRPGVFSHVKVALGDPALPLDATNCPVEGCGAVLELVPEPAPAVEIEPVVPTAVARLPDALADLGGADTAPPPEEPTADPLPDAPADQEPVSP